MKTFKLLIQDEDDQTIIESVIQAPTLKEALDYAANFILDSIDDEEQLGEDFKGY